MSTTKVKSLTEIRNNLERMPGKVKSFTDADWCINDLYEALRGLIEYIESDYSERESAFMEGMDKGLRMMQEKMEKDQCQQSP